LSGILLPIMASPYHEPRTPKPGVILRIVNNCLDDAMTEAESGDNELHQNINLEFSNRIASNINAVSVSRRDRDIPARAATFVPLEQKTSNKTDKVSKLSLARYKNKNSVSRLEEVPSKLRKSNSENRRPPAQQSSIKIERRSSWKSGVVLAENTQNVNGEVIVDKTEPEIIVPKQDFVKSKAFENNSAEAMEIVAKLDAKTKVMERNSGEAEEIVDKTENIEKNSEYSLEIIKSRDMNEFGNTIQANQTKDIHVVVEALKMPFKKVRVDVLALKLTPSLDTPSFPKSINSCYKEANSSLEVTNFKLSQALIQFYLLGRKFVNLSQLGLIDIKQPKPAIIVAITNILPSSFSSCLMVADKTNSVRLNMTQQAAKFWHSKLLKGQVILVTRMGVIMEGEVVRLVQVSSREGIKVVGMAANMRKLSSLKDQSFGQVRMNMRSNNDNVDKIETKGGEVSKKTKLSAELNEGEIANSKVDMSPTSRRKFDKHSVLADSSTEDEEEKYSSSSSLEDMESEDSALKDNSDDNVKKTKKKRSIRIRDKIMLNKEQRENKEINQLCDLGKLDNSRGVPGERGEGQQNLAKIKKIIAKQKPSKLNATSSESDLETDNMDDGNEDQEMYNDENARKFRFEDLLKYDDQDDMDEDENGEGVVDSSSEDGGDNSSVEDFDCKKSNISSDSENEGQDKKPKANKSGKKTRNLPNLLTFFLSENEDEGIDKKGIAAKKQYTNKKRTWSGSEDHNYCISDRSSRDDSDSDDQDGKGYGGDGCSCPSCNGDSSTLVTFSGKDLSSSCCKAVRKPTGSPNVSCSQLAPPQLDQYLTKVNVSFDELDTLSQTGRHSDSDQDHEAADLEYRQELDSLLALTVQQSQAQRPRPRPEQASLGELWLGKERNVGSKGKSQEIKIENGENNEMTLGIMKPEKEKEEEDIGDNEEEYGVKETYSEYSPVYLTYGLPHPDAVVESSSLASVLPPAITRALNLPQSLINQGNLSKVQLEAVAYASQIHEVIMPNKDRAGYLIGDGAGVGKGRTIAGIILENWKCGRKRSVWISASQDLMHDAARDLADIGVKNIKVKNLTSFGYHQKVDWEGVIYSTFSGLVGTTKVQSKRYNSRLEQLQDWLGRDGQFQGPIVFDECHKAKNLVPPKGGNPTRTGLAVLNLQNNNPNARVVYASATGASEPKNMAYMVRLGMWGQGINFDTFKEFSNALEKRGTGGLEQVALDLKIRGCYIARQLSFQGVDFSIVEVPLSKEFIQVYDESVDVWRRLQTLVYEQCGIYPPMEGRGDTRKRNFWGFMQKYFKYLAISSKISYVVGLAQKELNDGNCVVIALQSTGEAATELEMITNARERVLDNDPDSESFQQDFMAEKTSRFSSAASKMIKSVVTKLVPCQHTPELCDPADCEERKEVWKMVMELVPKLPTSSLDQLIDELGGPKNVAELTGRKKRLEKGCDGVFSYVKRLPQSGSCSDVNINEKELFMAGKKKVAIISAAASTGISLQADKRVKNQRRRVHITIELPWSADSAIQQFGRTHRSNQSSAPRYVYIISALHGEKRFASIVAKRLESLGALTHGDRRSTRTSDLSTFNFHNDYAASALRSMVSAITEGENIPMPNTPSQWEDKEEFYSWLADRMEEAGIYSVNKVLDEEKFPTITKFMNRLLCVKVEDQNVIFSFFSATLDRVIAQAKREGRYDTGIVDVVGQEQATQVDQHSFKVSHATGTTTTKITKFLITRGLSFYEAVKLSNNLQHPTEGFWLSCRKGLKLSVLVIAIPDAGNYRLWKYLVYRPNTGKVFTTMSYENLREKYKKVNQEVARQPWNEQYELSMTLCFHAYRSKDHTCKIIRDGGECEEGRRRRNYHVVSGSLLSVWPQIEEALGSCLVKSARKIQMIRIHNDEERIIGINIPNQVAGQMIDCLQKIDLTDWNREPKAETGSGEMNGSAGAVAAVQPDGEELARESQSEGSEMSNYETGESDY